MRGDARKRAHAAGCICEECQALRTSRRVSDPRSAPLPAPADQSEAGCVSPLCAAPTTAEIQQDVVNHPPHYTSHPSGIECIQVTEHMGFNLGNAIKYVWRADLKHDALEDLRKAVWYIEREIQLRESA